MGEEALSNVLGKTTSKNLESMLDFLGKKCFNKISMYDTIWKDLSCFFFSYALDWFGMEKVEQKRKTTCTSKLLRIEEINA